MARAQLLVLKEKCTWLRSLTPLPRGWKNANMSLCCGPGDGSHTWKAAEPSCSPAINDGSGWLAADPGMDCLYNNLKKTERLKNLKAFIGNLGMWPLL